MNILAVLPLAVVMVAGPQIISSFFFATGEKWRGDSAAYVFGAAIGLFAVITIVYLLASGSTSGGSEGESGSRTLDFAIVALLLHRPARLVRPARPLDRHREEACGKKRTVEGGARADPLWDPPRLRI